MIFFRLLTACIFFLSSYSLCFADNFPVVAYSKADALNVRSGQNTNFEVVAKLSKGEEIVVEEEQYGWYRIRLPKHAQVYMSDQFIKLLNGDIAEVVGSRVNVRGGPGEQFSVLGQVRAEDKVKVLEKSKGWVRIEPWPNMKGWVHGDFINVTAQKAGQAQQPNYTVVAIKDEKIGEAKDPIKGNQPQKQVQKGAFVEEVGRIKTADLNVCEEKLTHQLMRDGDIVVYLKGPTSVFNSFGVAAVRVKGTITRQPDDDCPHPVLSVSSVNLLL